MEIIGYPSCNQGLNNQKLALLGLIDIAQKENKKITLPRLANFDPATRQMVSTFHFSELFNLQDLISYVNKKGVEVFTDYYVKNITQATAFQHGCNVAIKDRIDFLRCLIPLTLPPPEFPIVMQLRIEKDWVDYLRERPLVCHGEDNDADYKKILKKVASMFSGDIYVTCHEESLAYPRLEIKQYAHNLNLNLIFKSDVLTETTYSLAFLSEYDFQIAAKAKVFIGTSRSTFSNMITTIRENNNCYLYNGTGETLAKRYDFGFYADFASAISSEAQALEK